MFFWIIILKFRYIFGIRIRSNTRVSFFVKIDCRISNFFGFFITLFSSLFVVGVIKALVGQFILFKAVFEGGGGVSYHYLIKK